MLPVDAPPKRSEKLHFSLTQPTRLTRQATIAAATPTHASSIAPITFITPPTTPPQGDSATGGGGITATRVTLPTPQQAVSSASSAMASTALATAAAETNQQQQQTTTTTPSKNKLSLTPLASSAMRPPTTPRGSTRSRHAVPAGEEGGHLRSRAPTRVSTSSSHHRPSAARPPSRSGSVARVRQDRAREEKQAHHVTRPRRQMAEEAASSHGMDAMEDVPDAPSHLIPPQRHHSMIMHHGDEYAYDGDVAAAADENMSFEERRELMEPVTVPALMDPDQACSTQTRQLEQRLILMQIQAAVFLAHIGGGEVTFDCLHHEMELRHRRAEFNDRVQTARGFIEQLANRFAPVMDAHAAAPYTTQQAYARREAHEPLSSYRTSRSALKPARSSRTSDTRSRQPRSAAPLFVPRPPNADAEGEEAQAMTIGDTDHDHARRGDDTREPTSNRGPDPPEETEM